MDIVEQLRDLCPHDVSGYCGCTAQQAADEIGRLRAELAAQCASKSDELAAAARRIAELEADCSTWEEELVALQKRIEDAPVVSRIENAHGDTLSCLIRKEDLLK